MNFSGCNQLEDYLAGALSEEQAVAFAAHLPRCPACRQAAEQQRQIDHSLRQAVSQLDLVPAGLIERIEGRMRRARRRCLLACGAALSAVAATLLVVMIGGWHLPDGHRPGTVAQRRSALVGEGRATPAQPRAQVTMADPSSAIVVPIESNMPNVTIVWIYPTIRPQPADSVPDTN